VSTSQDNSERLWRVFSSTQDLIDNAKIIVPRCLTRAQRQIVFLDVVPPAWCIDMEKWPYDAPVWKDWLKYQRANMKPPTPDTPEWKTWIAAQQTNSVTPNKGKN
jgi:hypothetical protein